MRMNIILLIILMGSFMTACDGEDLAGSLEECSTFSVGVVPDLDALNSLCFIDSMSIVPYWEFEGEITSVEANAFEMLALNSECNDGVMIRIATNIPEPFRFPLAIGQLISGYISVDTHYGMSGDVYALMILDEDDQLLCNIHSGPNDLDQTIPPSYTFRRLSTPFSTKSAERAGAKCRGFHNDCLYCNHTMQLLHNDENVEEIAQGERKTFEIGGERWTVYNSQFLSTCPQSEAYMCPHHAYYYISRILEEEGR